MVDTCHRQEEILVRGGEMEDDLGGGRLGRHQRRDNTLSTVRLHPWYRCQTFKAEMGSHGLAAA